MIYPWKEFGIRFALWCLDAGFSICESLWEFEGMTDFMFGRTRFWAFVVVVISKEIDLFLLITRDSEIGMGMAGWLGFHVLPLLANRSMNGTLKTRLLSCIQ